MSSQVFADSPRHIINQSVRVRGSSNQRSTFLVITASCLQVKVYLIVIGYEFSVYLRQVTVKAAECSRLAGG